MFNMFNGGVAVLGIRLSDQLETQLESQARREGRSKSDIARQAIVDYLRRHGDEDEYVRQARHLADRLDEQDLEWLDRAFDDAMSTEPPYDWGDAH